MTDPVTTSRTLAATVLREEAAFLYLLLGTAADDGGLRGRIARLLADADLLESEGRVDD